MKGDTYVLLGIKGLKRPIAFLAVPNANCIPFCPFQAWALPVCLPWEGAKRPAVGDRLTITGWGATEFGEGGGGQRGLYLLKQIVLMCKL